MAFEKGHPKFGGRKKLPESERAIRHKASKARSRKKNIKQRLAYAKQHPEQRRNWHLLRYYGITLKQYNKMFAKQQGCCAICGKHQSEFKRVLSVEHCHITNKVRGLVCDTCNRLIGVYETNFSNLKNNIKTYLKG